MVLVPLWSFTAGYLFLLLLVIKVYTSWHLGLHFDVAVWSWYSLGELGLGVGTLLGLTHHDVTCLNDIFSVVFLPIPCALRLNWWEWLLPRTCSRCWCVVTSMMFNVYS